MAVHANSTASLWLHLKQPDVGRAIVLLRLRCGSGRRLVERMRGVEPCQVDEAALYKWESGRHEPSARYRDVLARTCDDLLTELPPAEQESLLQSLRVMGTNGGLPVSSFAGWRTGASSGASLGSASALPIPEALANSGMLQWLSVATGMPVQTMHEIVGVRAMDLSPTVREMPPPDAAVNALLGYYGTAALARHGFHPYRLLCDRKSVATTMITSASWLGQDIPLKAGEATSATCLLVDPPLRVWSPLPELVTDRAIDRLAEAASLGRRAPVMVNKPLYRVISVRIADGTLYATFALDQFAHYALTYDLMERELAEAIANGDLSQLPLRDALMPDVRWILDLEPRLAPCGLECLLAIARPESEGHPADFLIVLQRRSSRVLNVSGGLAVIPKAFHQHLVNASEEVHIRTTLRRELEEELFGREDVDESHGRPKLRLNPYHPVALSEPLRFIDQHDACDFRCTCAGVNMLTGNFEFGCLACIHDERFWGEFGGACIPNWEADEVQVYSSQDGHALARLIADPSWAPEALFAFVEGLRSLSRLHPDRVRLPTLSVLLS